MRPRISFRTLFIASAFASLLLYYSLYWLILPATKANQFIEAVVNQQYEAVDRMFLDADDQFFAEWHNEYWAFQPHAELAPSSLGQYLSGKRHVLVTITYGNPGRLHGCEGKIAATARGLNSPQFTELDFGGMNLARQ